MQYDANDRLTAAYSPAFGGDGWYRFGYDALDNLRTWTQPGEGQRRYDYDASNRLTGIRNAGGAAIMGFAYDVQGNLSLKNGQGYQFDYGNRLRQATNLERYRYDGHGRRSSVIDAGSGHNRHYLYSQGGALAYLWDQGTGEYTQYIQLAGSLVATRKVDAGGAAAVRYQHTDALGSPVAETNQQAVVVQRTAYTPYGASIGAQKDGVGYTGHVMDGSTGLTYMQQRYMDPGVGAFLSVDPVTAFSNPVAMFHRYKYGANNPYRFFDPDGRVEREKKDWRTIAARSPGSSARMATSAAVPSRTEMQSRIVASANPAEYDRRDPTFHEYNIGPVGLCREGPGCSVSTLAAMVDADSAPKFGSVTQGPNVLHLNNPIMHTSFLGEDGAFYMINATTSSHDFHAGAVVSRLYSGGGYVNLETSGFGYSSGRAAKFANYLAGYSYFSAWQLSLLGAAKIESGQVRPLK